LVFVNLKVMFGMQNGDMTRAFTTSIQLLYNFNNFFFFFNQPLNIYDLYIGKQI
jgi:hypothetical protein